MVYTTRRNVFVVFLMMSLMVLIVLFTTVQSGAAEKEKYVFGLSMRGVYDDHTVAMVAGFKDECVRLGIEPIVYEAEMDPSTQLRQIDDLIQSKCDVIVVYPQDSAGIVPAIKRVNEAGTVCITQDSEILGGKSELFIAGSNVGMGRRAGEFLVELLTKKYGSPKGVILELMGDIGMMCAVERGRGFHEVVDKYKDIEVISKPCEWSADQAFTTTETQFSAIGAQIDGIFCHSDGCYYPGVIPALKATGHLFLAGDPNHVFLVGIDGSKTAITAIREGSSDGTVLQFPDKYGEWAVQYGLAFLEGKKVPEAGSVIEGNAPWLPTTFGTVQTGLALWFYPAIVPKDVSAYDMRLYAVKALISK